LRESDSKSILASQSTCISELKANPDAAIDGCRPCSGDLQPDKPVAYLIQAETRDAMLDKLDDIDMVAVVRQREGEPMVKVDVDAHAL